MRVSLCAEDGVRGRREKVRNRFSKGEREKERERERERDKMRNGRERRSGMTVRGDDRTRRWLEREDQRVKEMLLRRKSKREREDRG